MMRLFVIRLLLALAGLVLLNAPASAQTAASLSPSPNLQFFDMSSGQSLPCVGCTVSTFAAGTSTPLKTYTDSTATSQNGVIITLDSNGYTTSGIWIGGVCYKYVLKNASAATVWTQDNICDNAQLIRAALAGSSGASGVGFQPLGGSVPATVASALNSAFIYDSGFDSAAHVCGSSITVAVTKQSLWTGLSTMTCAAHLWFPTATGVAIRPASGQTITLTGSITAAPGKIFDFSFGGSIKLSASTSRAPVEWWGAVADYNGTTGTDNTTAFSNALATVKTSPDTGGDIKTNTPPSPCLYLGTGQYLIDHLTMADYEYTKICGSGPNASFIVINPTSAGTDGIAFSSTGIQRFGNSLSELTLVSVSSNTRRVLSVSMQNQFLLSNVTFNCVPIGDCTNELYMAGMQTSRIVNSRFYGSGSGTDDAIVIAASPISTTVTFDGIDIEGSLGACLNAGGSSGAATIVLLNSTLENCKYAIQASTNVIISANHFEHSNMNAIFTPSGALIQSGGANNFQQCAAVGGTLFNLAGSTILRMTSSDVTDLAAGCTLMDLAAGSSVTWPGPLLSTSGLGGTIATGSGVLDAGVLASHTFSLSGVSGTNNIAPFRGNFWLLGIAGGTTLHVQGGATGGATPIGLPPGEIITVFLSSAPSGCCAVTMAGGNTGDFPILGQIIDTGRAANTHQTVTLQVDNAGNVTVANSPGWSAN